MKWWCAGLRRGLAVLALLLGMLLVVAAPTSAQQQVAYGPGGHQRADLYSAGEGAPVLVLVTGGGWIRNEPSVARPFATSLQSAGVTVLVPHYTLSAPNTAAEDIARAVTYAGELPERGRLTLGGHSAGAHLAALI